MEELSKKVIVVVVTYNRKVLLKECLDALLSQKYQNFNILVIDNASTDGTKEYIEDVIDNEKVLYKNTGANIGGAGGFNYGMKEACKFKCDYIWIMDDDTIVKEDSLEKLLLADKLLKGNYGFLSSSVLWKDGKTPCVMNRQKITKNWYEKSNYLKYSIIKTYYSTFVSFFIKKETVKKEGLPIKEFFIWGDDVEYTNRISKKYDCYIIGNSQVIHKTKENNGSDISKENGDRINRYKYAYRNECVVARENGINGRIRQFAKVNYHILRVCFTKNTKKLKKIAIIINSSVKGIFFRPKIEYIEEE